MSLDPIALPNLTKFTKRKPDLWKNKNKRVFQDSCGIIIVGPTDAGKTSNLLAAYLQTKVVDFDQIWYFTKDKSEPLCQLLAEMMARRGLSSAVGGKLPDKDEEEEDAAMVDASTYDQGAVEKKKKAPKEDTTTPLPDFILEDDFSKIPDVTRIDPHKSTVIIFDDVMTESKKVQKPILDLYKGGRKRTCQCFYIAQNWSRVPLDVRRNAKYYCVYRLQDPRELALIARCFELYMSPQSFRKIYLHATTDDPKKPGEKRGKPNFLLVNTKMRFLPYRYRQGFNRVLDKVPL